MESQDERLKGIISPVLTNSELVPSHNRIGQQIAAIWKRHQQELKLPIIHLCSDDFASMQAIAANVVGAGSTVSVTETQDRTKPALAPTDQCQTPTPTIAPLDAEAGQTH